MISTYTFVYFPQHVFNIFSRDALKDGCEETLLVQASLMISEPGLPRPDFSCFFRVVDRRPSIM